MPIAVWAVVVVVFLFLAVVTVFIMLRTPHQPGALVWSEDAYVYVAFLQSAYGTDKNPVKRDDIEGLEDQVPPMVPLPPLSLGADAESDGGHES